MGSIPGLTLWVKGSRVAWSCGVGYRCSSAYASSHSSNSTPNLGISICHWCSHKKRQNNNNDNNNNNNEKSFSCEVDHWTIICVMTLPFAPLNRHPHLFNQLLAENWERSTGLGSRMPCQEVELAWNAVRVTLWISSSRSCWGLSNSNTVHIYTMWTEVWHLSSAS